MKSNERVCFTNPEVKTELRTSNLPIVIIDTRGKQEKISDAGYTDVEMRIINNGEGQLNIYGGKEIPNQTLEYEGLAKIRIRGNTTKEVKKKSFAVRLVDEKGNELKQKLFGRKKSDKWCLLAIHKDRTLMRDALTYNLSEAYLDYVPHVYYCELIVDDIYQGVYLFAEQVSRERLGIKKSEAGDDLLQGGFLVEKDRTGDLQSSCNTLQTSSKALFEIKYPKDKNLSSGQRQHIELEIKALETAIASGDYQVFSEHVDIESFATFHLIQEFTNNIDAYRFSHKFYKRKGEELFKMTIWDFDLAYGNVKIRNGQYVDVDRDIQEQSIFWWSKMKEDSTYRDAMSRRWQEMREGDFSDEHIEHVIDSLSSLLQVNDAIVRNHSTWEVWTKPYEDGTDYMFTGNSYEQQTRFLKYWITCRLKYMDAKYRGVNDDDIKTDSCLTNYGRMSFYQN